MSVPQCMLYYTIHCTHSIHWLRSESVCPTDPTYSAVPSSLSSAYTHMLSMHMHTHTHAEYRYAERPSMLARMRLLN